MADNVTIGISADVTQAKAQLGVLQASLRDVRKEWRQLAQEQAQNKGADPTRYLEVTRQLQGLDREIAKHVVVTHASTRANTEHTDSFRRMGIELSHLAHAAGLSNEVLRATKFGLAGLVGTQLIRTLGEVAERFRAINDQAKQTGAGIENIQVLGKAFKETGGTAADASGVIDKIAGTVRDAERAFLQAGGTLGGPATLRGGVKDLASEVMTFGNTSVDVYRGASKAAVDFGDKLKGVRVNIQDLYRQFPNSSADRTQAVIKGIAAELNNLVKAGKFAEANLRSLDLTGVSLDRALPALNRFVKERDRLLAEMRQQGTLLDPQTSKKALEYAIAVDDVTDSYQGLQQQIALMVFPDATKWIKELQEFLKRPEGEKTAWEEFLAVDEFKKNIALMEGYWNDFMALLRFTQGKLSATGGPWGDPGIPAMPLPTATSAGGGSTSGSEEVVAYAPIPGNASGGYIRGPGSGRSDSILARLSNGEFVLNAGSVRRLGVGFLQGLNSFAGGGLVGSLPRFAGGGAVSSPAGFTLVIGGHSFNASTDNATAASLARVARSQSMRSAGRKPGWAN